MKNPRLEKPQSMPELQLQETGTEVTYDTLLNASRNLSENERELLEDDLSFYADTGLVGIQMSKLLALLQLDASEIVAEESSVA